jgi:hypothetical protein
MYNTTGDILKKFGRALVCIFAVIIVEVYEFTY